MSLLFMDSFDHYATADLPEKWTLSWTDSAVGAAYARTGAGGLYVNDGVRRNVPPQTSLVCGAAIKPISMHDANPIFWIGNSTPHGGYRFDPDYSSFCTLWMNLDGGLELYVGNGDGGTLLKLYGASAGITGEPFVLRKGVWSYVELKMSSISATAQVTVRVNNAVALSVTANTILGWWITQIPLYEWTYFQTGLGGQPFGSGSFAMDDLYVANLDGAGITDFIGDCRIDCHYPTAPGTHADWTRSGTDSGANWDQVNETAPNDDVDANDGTAAGDIDTFACDDLVPEGNTIVAVQHVMSVRKTDAGVATVAPVMRVGGTDFVGDDQYPSADAYAFGRQIYETSPSGGAWTEADFNNMEVGYKRTA